MANEILYHLTQNENFTPTSTIIVRLSYKSDADSIEFILSDAEIHKETDIKKFLADLAKDPHPTPSTTKAPNPNRLHPLGIPVDASANIVVILDPTLKWRFRSGNPAITAKADCGDDNYGVWHVTAAGTPRTDYPADCQMAYFSVVKRPKKPHPHSIQRFNLHLELQQDDGRWLEVAIDPDVPEMGSEGFPTPLVGKSLTGATFDRNSIVVHR